MNYLAKVTPHFDFKKAMNDNLDVYIKELSDMFESVSESEFDEFISDFKDDGTLDFVKSLDVFSSLDEKILDILPSFVSKDNRNHVVHILKMNFFSKIIPSSTGVVIAGFSEEDLFPSFISFEITLNNFGRIESKILEYKLDYQLGCIVPFAQRDVIDTFLTGSSILVKKIIEVALLDFLNEYSDVIIESISSNENIDEKSCDEFIMELEKIKSIHDVTSKKFIDFLGDWEEIIVQSLFVSVQSMTKKDLIEMAYSLIKVTSMRRKMDSEVESVGGDIAIAIITKGDGFEWINEVNLVDKI